MKSIKMLLTAVVAILLTTNAANAQAVRVANVYGNFTVKFAGIENDYLVFEVAIMSNNIQQPTLKINDRVEGELYAQNWKPKTATQIFKIEKKDGQELSFNLQVGSKTVTKTFSTTTRLVESTFVNENELVSL